MKHKQRGFVEQLWSSDTKHMTHWRWTKLKEQWRTVRLTDLTDYRCAESSGSSERVLKDRTHTPTHKEMLSIVCAYPHAHARTDL